MLQRAAAVRRANAIKARGSTAHPAGPHVRAVRPHAIHGPGLVVKVTTTVTASANYPDGTGSTAGPSTTASYPGATAPVRYRQKHR